MEEEVTLKVARTPKEVSLFQEMLFEEYCLHLGWHDPRSFPNRLFTDEYDQFATFFVVCQEAEIVGGFRLVRDSKFGFPHEQLLSTKLPVVNNLAGTLASELLTGVDRTGIREITRLISKPGHRRPMVIDFVKCLHWYGALNQVQVYFMTIDLRLFLLCQKLAVPLVPIDLMKFCEGSWTVPCILNLKYMRIQLNEENQKAWEYISDRGNIAGEWSGT